MDLEYGYGTKDKKNFMCKMCLDGIPTRTRLTNKGVAPNFMHTLQSTRRNNYSSIFGKPKTLNSSHSPMEKKRSRDRDEKPAGPPDLPPHRPYGGRPHPQHPPQSRVQPIPRSEPVDREKTCPLLLRVFTKVGGHHDKEEFSVRGKEPKDEVQIYTWKDATLRELADLVKEVSPAARRRDAKLSFAFVYPDKHGRFVVREVGQTFSYGNGRRLDDNKALEDLGFQIGDYLDVAIL